MRDMAFDQNRNHSLILDHERVIIFRKEKTRKKLYSLTQKNNKKTCPYSSLLVGQKVSHKGKKDYGLISDRDEESKFITGMEQKSSSTDINNNKNFKDPEQEKNIQNTWLNKM